MQGYGAGAHSPQTYGYSAAGYGAGTPGFAPPSLPQQPRSALPWVIGGVVGGLVLIAALCGGVVMWIIPDGDDPSIAAGTPAGGAATTAGTGTGTTAAAPPNMTPAVNPTPAAGGTTSTSPPFATAGGADELPPSGSLPRHMVQPPADAADNAAMTAEPPRVWELVVDPLPEGLGVREDLPDEISVALPGGGTFGSAVFPVAPTGFVAVAGRKGVNEITEFWDLRYKRKLGTMKIDGVRVNDGALSPDGLHFAVQTGVNEGIGVWDVKGEKALGTLPIEGFLKLIAFPATDRVVAATHNTGLMIWSIPSGEAQREIKLPDWYADESVSFSPGGRYMTVVFREQSEQLLRVIDLVEGKAAGELALPTYDNGRTLNCQALDFSPDGTLLAGLFDFDGGSKLLCWKVEDASIATEVDYDERVQDAARAFGYKGPRLEWFPKQDRLLAFGHVVLDRNVAKSPIYVFPEDPLYPRDTPRRVLGDEHLAVVAENQRGARGVIAVELPAEELARAAAVVNSGGLAVDTRLPPLTSADWSSTPIIPFDEAADWNVVADPAPQAAGKLLAQPLALKSGGARTDAILLSGLDRAQAAVLATPQGAGAATAARLDFYDLSAGSQRKSIDIPFACALLAYSPDGTRAAVRLAEGEDRLDVYDADGGSHLLGWRPYQIEEDRNQQKVTAAVFLDSQHLLTLSNANKLVCWKLPECQALYLMEQVRAPGISPGGKYLAISGHRAYRFFDARTGEGRGDLVWNGLATAAAFHPAGDRFVVSVLRDGGAALVGFNLADGSQAFEFPAARNAGRSLHYCGDDYLLMDDQYLVSLKNQIVLWRYDLVGGVHIPQSPDGRHWYAAQRTAGTPGILLAAADLPDVKALDAMAGNPRPRFLVEPGSKVSLAIRAQNPPGMPMFQQDVRKNLTDRFAAYGITVAEGQSVVLELSTTQRNTGDTLEFESFGIGGQRVSVPKVEVTCRAAFTSGGKTLWENGSLATNDTWGFIVHLEQGETIQQHLDKQLWGAVGGFFLSLAPPRYVFAEGQAEGLGASQLTAAGVQ
jgi:WD40 repeat protein